MAEKTFASYDQKQSQAYNQLRLDYNPEVYATILEKHTSTGGQLKTLLDVGCGPGLATKTLAKHFDHAVGLDASKGMIEMARTRGLTTRIDEPVRFEYSPAEELGGKLDPPVTDGSVDLITAANAAHWFDMPGFWKAAARVLKPGGTVVLWCSGGVRFHPSMPSFDKLNAILDEHHKVMMPYMEKGNFLTHEGYRTLPLPWTDGGHVEGFDQQHFERLDWPVDKPFYASDQELSPGAFEKIRATSSFVTRWRQANPQLIGEQDAVRIVRRQIEHVLHEAGVKPGEEKLKGIVHGVLLILKRT